MPAIRCTQARAAGEHELEEARPGRLAAVCVGRHGFAAVADAHSLTVAAGALPIPISP